MKNIPYGKQFIDETDINAVVETLKSPYLTQGPKVEEFESEFKNYVKADHALAVNNGTSALHLSVLALGLKKGDKVICPTITFAASANCIRYCGAEVIFCDIDPTTYLLDFDHLEILLKLHKITGVISVDFAGKPVNLEKLYKLSTLHNFWIVEDACHSPGGYFIDSTGAKQYCGNGSFADLAIFSFHPVKHIACGEGGMITTKKKSLYDKIKLLRTHGITKNPNEFKNSQIFKTSSPPAWYYEMQDLGYNYRLTDIQSALGLSQLKKASSGIEKRQNIANYYYQNLKNQKGIFQIQNSESGHAFHLFIMQVERRDELYRHLQKNGVHCQIHYYPLHLMPYYSNITNIKLPNSESYIEKCISLPMFPTLKIEELDYIIGLIKKFLNP